MNLDAFDDGYTHSFRYEAIPGLHNGNSGTFRPANYVQRESVHAKFKSLGGEDAAKLIAATVASHVKTWALKLNGKSLPITLNACCNQIHPAHIERMFQIVMGNIPSCPFDDTNPAPLAGQDYADQLLAVNPSVDALQGN